MSLQLNSVMIAGHLTRDPEVKFLSGDRSVANFSIATTRTWKDQDGKKHQEPTFVDVEAFGSQAEFVGKYFGKGSAMFVSGRLKLDQWKDKEGNPRQRLKVHAIAISFVESKADSSEEINEETGEVTRRAAKGGAS